jgi:hypothetical protein
VAGWGGGAQEIRFSASGEARSWPPSSLPQRQHVTPPIVPLDDAGAPRPEDKWLEQEIDPVGAFRGPADLPGMGGGIDALGAKRAPAGERWGAEGKRGKRRRGGARRGMLAPWTLPPDSMRALHACMHAPMHGPPGALATAPLLIPPHPRCLPTCAADAERAANDRWRNPNGAPAAAGAAAAEADTGAGRGRGFTAGRGRGLKREFQGRLMPLSAIAALLRIGKLMVALSHQLPG